MGDLDYRRIIGHVNYLRARHQAPAVQMDETLSQGARNWSRHLASVHQLQHSHNGHYGENLAYFGGHQADLTTLVLQSIDNWYNERTRYHGQGYSPQTGHFTQLVWSNTNRVGVGVARSGHNVYVTMRFVPPGNVQGRFGQNVH